MKVTIKELTIESDSDFSHVNIDFSKGSMQTTTSNTPFVSETPASTTKKSDIFKDAVLDLDEEFDIPEEVVEKPVIEDVERVVLVSEDMQSAEF